MKNFRIVKDLKVGDNIVLPYLSCIVSMPFKIDSIEKSLTENHLTLRGESQNIFKIIILYQYNEVEII